MTPCMCKCGITCYDRAHRLRLANSKQTQQWLSVPQKGDIFVLSWLWNVITLAMVMPLERCCLRHWHSSDQLGGPVCIDM